jgi:hypothetical protein
VIFFVLKYKFKENIFNNINEYLIIRTEYDDILIKFVDELKENFLNKILKLPNSNGNLNEFKI